MNAGWLYLLPHITAVAPSCHKLLCCKSGGRHILRDAAEINALLDDCSEGGKEAVYHLSLCFCSSGGLTIWLPPANFATVYIGHPKVQYSSLCVSTRLLLQIPARVMQEELNHRDEVVCIILFRLYPHPCAAVLLLLVFLPTCSSPERLSRSLHPVEVCFSFTWRSKLSTFHC